MAYHVVYSPNAQRDLSSIRRFDRNAILDAIQKHLCSEPLKESRSTIKKMDQPFWSQYRLRVGDFRVYYDVDEDQEVVTVLRVLMKGTEETPKEDQR